MQRGSTWPCALVVLGAMLLFVGGCQHQARPVHNIVIVGSRSMLPVLREIADHYLEDHPEVRFHLEPGSTERAVEDTRAGLANVGLLGRALRPEETGLTGSVLARDGVAFLVHQDNPVRQIPDPAISGLLTHAYGSWKDLGGQDRPIILIGPGEGRGIRDTVLEHFSLRPLQSRPDFAVATTAQVLQSVAAQPAGLGYASLGEVDAMKEKYPVRLLAVEGIAPTMENVRTSHYPIVRPLVLLSRDPSEETRGFLEFARSSEMGEVVRKHGFVPASAVEVLRAK